MILVLLLLGLPIIYFIFFKKNTKTELTKAEIKQQRSKKNKKEENDRTSSTEKQVEEPQQKPQEKPKKVYEENKAIINHFRETKEIVNYNFSADCSTIVFHDEKKFYLAFNSNFLEKNIPIYSKTVEYDVISDAAFSKDKQIMVVALKNSKDLIFYELKEDNGKLKFFKLDKKIKTERKFDIKRVIITKDGGFALTSGTSQDTEIQIFDVTKAAYLHSIDINEIENEDMKFNPECDYATISTSLYELASIHMSKVSNHKKNSQTEEISLKAEKKNSVSVKEPIFQYDFTNSNNFFVVLTKDSKIKLYQNYGTFPESKSIHEYKVSSAKATAASAYVIQENHRLDGYFAYAAGSSVVITDVQGRELKSLPDVADSNVIAIKLVKQGVKLLAITAGRDGKFNIIDTSIQL